MHLLKLRLLHIFVGVASDIQLVRRHDIAEILSKVALNTINNKQSKRNTRNGGVSNSNDPPHTNQLYLMIVYNFIFNYIMFILLAQMQSGTVMHAPPVQYPAQVHYPTTQQMGSYPQPPPAFETK